MLKIQNFNFAPKFDKSGGFPASDFFVLVEDNFTKENSPKAKIQGMSQLPSLPRWYRAHQPCGSRGVE